MRRPSPTVLAVAFAALAPSALAQNTPQNPSTTPAASVDTAGINMAAAAATEDHAAATAERPTPTPPPTSLLDRIGSMVEVHGYLRARPEWMHQFDLGWDDLAFRNAGGNYASSQLPWVRNPDNGLPNLCSTAATDGSSNRVPGDCTGRTQSMANMRFRINPEIHVTDNIAIYSQIDVFDNLILGSTPQGYYSGSQGSPWAPVTGFSSTQVTPTEQNSLTPSITVSRAWAEVTNQTLGQIRFGRMPGQWGLGLLANAGNGIDSDFQSHSDRIMYAARVRPLNLFLAAFYDFASTGATSASLRYESGQGQPIDISQLDDVNQYGLALGHRVEPAEARQRLSRGQLVINGGLYGLFRQQTLSAEFINADPAAMRDQRTVGSDGAFTSGALRRDAWAVISDLWFQVLHRNFRFELEAAFIYGQTTIGRAAADPGLNPYRLTQFGGAAEFEYRLLNNRLTLEFKTGYATGDSDLEGINYHNGLIAPQRAGATSNTLFRFHPNYRVDMILWRQIFRQVSGAYYFRPGVTYAFVNSPGGDRLYGRAAVIWSRASEFVQTRGNAADLGIEINAEVTYQSNFRDTTLGDRPGAGFFASLQYGVLFPMAGLGPREDERATSTYSGFSFSTAQTLRGVVGVMY
ncbi:MAG: TIGR04551 family protein [Myxococcaceae bacterium]|nr:MAG: TIGR04551 family protein [Myxococcaceae bacterium]